MTDLIKTLRYCAGQMAPSGLGGPGHGLHPDRASLLTDAAGEIERLRALLKECSDDLEAYIAHHYDKTLDYPSQRLKFDGEMVVVLEARRVLACEQSKPEQLKPERDWRAGRTRSGSEM